MSAYKKSKDPNLNSRSSAILNEGTDEELIITGFRLNVAKSMFMGLLFILTSGLLWLFLYWMPKIRLRFTHDEVDLEFADTVLVEVIETNGYKIKIENIYYLQNSVYNSNQFLIILLNLTLNILTLFFDILN